MEAIRINAKQTEYKKELIEDIYLEIQYGDGPYGSTVSRPIKLGENISLVVRAITPNTSNSAFAISPVKLIQKPIYQSLEDKD